MVVPSVAGQRRQTFEDGDHFLVGLHRLFDLSPLRTGLPLDPCESRSEAQPNPVYLVLINPARKGEPFRHRLALVPERRHRLLGGKRVMALLACNCRGSDRLSVAPRRDGKSAAHQQPDHHECCGNTPSGVDDFGPAAGAVRNRAHE